MARDASLLVTDRGYVRLQRRWREHVALHALCPVVQVETDVVVPVDVVSRKEEYAAATIRPKLHRHLARFLVPLAERPLRKDSLGLRLGGLGVTNLLIAFAPLHVFALWDMVARPSMLVGVDVMRQFEDIVLDFGRREVLFWPPRYA